MLGTTRRAAAQDSLAGQAGAEPVTIQGPGTMAPQPMQRQGNDAASALAQQLGGWASKKLETASNTRNSKDYMDGIMAFEQGVAQDDLQMAGNKWALEGHRYMDAQTLSSSLLAAQQQEIAQSSHTLSPDAYRERFVNRLDGMLEGKDERTQDMVREQMAKQMPQLVGAHVTANAKYLEQENYSSLERSIDVISRDPTATTELLDFARGGEGSASDGLSDARRQSAVVSGVLRAFDGDNAMAYSALAGAGLLGDNLTTAEQGAIKQAQKQFESRRRSEYNETLFNGEQALMLKVEQGMDPSKAVEELALLYADHGIQMNAADAGGIYAPAQAAGRVNDRTAAVNFEDARLRGDWDTMARITEPMMVQRESGGNPDAVSEAGARGTHQVMDGTNMDPGFGITPAKDNSQAERARVGSDYWRMLMNRYKGDLEAAAVGYNAGPANGDKFVAAGNDYSVLPKRSETEPYAKDIVASLKGWAEPTPDDRLDIAKASLKKTRARLAMDIYEEMQFELAPFDQQFRDGAIDREMWKDARDAVHVGYATARTMADISHEVAVSRGVEEGINQKRLKLVADDADEARISNLDDAHASLFGQRAAMEAVLDNEESTPQMLTDAVRVFRGAREATMNEYGISYADRNTQASDEQLFNAMTKSMKASREYTEDGVEIDRALGAGSVGSLPKKLQRRAFDNAREEVQTMADDAVASGRLTEAQADDQIASDLNAVWAQAGMVDPQVKHAASTAINMPLIDKDGNPNPRVMDGIQQYADLKAINPRAAATMLTPEALVRAEEVMSRLSSPELMGEAVKNLGVELTGAPGVEDTTTYMAKPDVQRRINQAADQFLADADIGIFQAMFSGGATTDQIHDTALGAAQQLRTDETKEQVREELALEVAALQRINPNYSAAGMVSEAGARLDRRMAIVGGDVVMLGQGADIGKSFFGGKANDFRHEGDINSAVIGWLRSPEARAQYPGTTDSIVSERLPGWVQGAANAVVANIPFTNFEFKPAMSMQESIQTGLTGIRPFRSYRDGSGKGLVVEVLKPDGSYSDPIIVPMEEAGRQYMQRRQNEAQN